MIKVIVYSCRSTVPGTRYQVPVSWLHIMYPWYMMKFIALRPNAFQFCPGMTDQDLPCTERLHIIMLYMWCINSVYFHLGPILTEIQNIFCCISKKKESSQRYISQLYLCNGKTVSRFLYISANMCIRLSKKFWMRVSIIQFVWPSSLL